MNWIYLLFVGEVILLLFSLLFTKGDYTSPSVITNIMFTLETLCIIRNVDFWNSHMSPETFAIVLSGLTVINIIEMMVNLTFAKKKCWVDAEIVRNEVPITISRPIYFFILMFCVIGSIYYVLQVMKMGGVRSVAAIAIVKSSTEIKVNTLAKIFYRLLRQVPYALLFVFAHNTALCRQKVRRNFKLLIPVFFSMVAIFFSGSRAQYMILLEAISMETLI